MKKSAKALLCAFLACAGIVPAAQATTITWNVAGTSTAVGPDLPVFTDNLFSFTLAFDSAAPLINPASTCATDADACRYVGGSIRITDLVLGGLVIGDTEFFQSGPDSGRITVRDNDPLENAVWDGVSFQVFDYSTSGQLDLFGLTFRTTNTSFWSSSAIPTSPEGLDSMELASFQIASYPTGTEPYSAFIDGVVTSVTAVPEPASLALLGLGLAGLGLARRRKVLG